MEEKLHPGAYSATLLCSTSFDIAGHRIIKTLGVVRGIVVRSRSVFGTFGATLQLLIGGNITLWTELCEKARSEAFEIMVANARALGANAIIGIRYDSTEIAQGVTEVLAYGTAAIVEAL